MKNLLILAIATAAAASAQVGIDRILQAEKEPQNWLTYSGNYNSQRYSKLTQITPENVKNLELQWVYQARSWKSTKRLRWWSMASCIPCRIRMTSWRSNL